MLVQRVVVSDALDTNAYFYIDQNSGHGFLVDPGAEADKLLRVIGSNRWVIEKILLTHGHFDHIGAVGALHDALGIPYFIHIEGSLLLNDPVYNLSCCYGGARDIVLKDAGYLSDGEKLTLQVDPSAALTVMNIPGHTPDSVAYYDEVNHLAFVVDTIFRNGVGSVAFPGSNAKQLRTSIAKILALPPTTRLYPGHFDATTVREEQL